jgi:hypothetical protein
MTDIKTEKIYSIGYKRSTVKKLGNKRKSLFESSSDII